VINYSGGYITLSGNPTITGTIFVSAFNGVRVNTSDFTPSTGKLYTLVGEPDFFNVGSAVVQVTGSGLFLDYFTLSARRGTQEFKLVKSTSNSNLVCAAQ